MIAKFLLAVTICAAFLSGCTKTPKEQSMAGFKESCYSVDTPEVKMYCDCMVEKLDAAIPAKVYNDRDADPFALTRAFQTTAMQFAPICKAASAGATTASTASAPMSGSTYEGTSAKYDSRDPDSLQRMMSEMSPVQQAQFLKDFELLVYLHGGGEGEEGMGRGEVVLHGYTVERVKTEAAVAPGYIRERNATFLQKTLSDMEASAKQDACIYENKFGVLLPPRTHLRPYDACKHYSRSRLEAMRADASGNTDARESPAATTEPTPTQTLPDGTIVYSDGTTYSPSDVEEDPELQGSSSPSSQVPHKWSQLSEAAKTAIQEGFVEVHDPKVLECTDKRIEDIKKANGDEYAIDYQTYNEIAVECGFNI